jgi:hypothetical protein
MGPGLILCSSVIRIFMEGWGYLLNPSVRIFRISVDIRAETSEYDFKKLTISVGFLCEIWECK